MPLDPTHRAADQDPRTLTLQIDPYRGAVLYQLLQGTEPFEVGWAYVTGSSRLDAVEHWLLYASVDDQAMNANKRAYAWPSGSPEPVGLHFKFVRVDHEFEPAKYKTELEDSSGVKVVHIKATCTPGS